MPDLFTPFAVLAVSLLAFAWIWGMVANGKMCDEQWDEVVKEKKRGR